MLYGAQTNISNEELKHIKQTYTLDLCTFSNSNVFWFKWFVCVCEFHSSVCSLYKCPLDGCSVTLFSSFYLLFRNMPRKSWTSISWLLPFPPLFLFMYVFMYIFSPLWIFSKRYFREIKYMDMNGSWQNYLLITWWLLLPTALVIAVVYLVPSEFPVQAWKIFWQRI